MGNLDRAASIEDLRRIARRRLPRFAFDFIDGGAESETGLRGNETAFSCVQMLPRYLIDVSDVRVETAVFGETYAAPFGLSTIGFLNVAGPGSDLAWARLAAKRRIPHVISTHCSTPLEKVAAAADGMAWFQLYASTNLEIRELLLGRAEAAGCRVLVVTVDVPASGVRDRDVRNEAAMPFRITPRIALDLALHPVWALGTLRAGAPGFGNFDIRQFSKGGRLSVGEIARRVISNTFAWDDLRRIRDRWKGPLVVKGLLHPEDALRAFEIGCDGISVSNHGGRQADFAPAAIEALPAIRAAVGPDRTLLIDSGVRRGTDLIRARALGADFALLGRAFAYGVAAGGDAGCARAFDIIDRSLRAGLAQLGRPHFADIDASVLFTGPVAAEPPRTG